MTALDAAREIVANPNGYNERSLTVARALLAGEARLAAFERVVEALSDVWAQCVDARNDRIIGASDDSPGSRPEISGDLMQKIYAALIRSGVDAPLCYGNKRNAAGDAALARARDGGENG